MTTISPFLSKTSSPDIFNLAQSLPPHSPPTEVAADSKIYYVGPNAPELTQRFPPNLFAEPEVKFPKLGDAPEIEVYASSNAYKKIKENPERKAAILEARKAAIKDPGSQIIVDSEAKIYVGKLGKDGQGRQILTVTGYAVPPQSGQPARVVGPKDPAYQEPSSGVRGSSTSGGLVATTAITPAALGAVAVNKQLEKAEAGHYLIGTGKNALDASIFKNSSNYMTSYRYDPKAQKEIPVPVYIYAAPGVLGKDVSKYVEGFKAALNRAIEFASQNENSHVFVDNQRNIYVVKLNGDPPKSLNVVNQVLLQEKNLSFLTSPGDPNFVAPSTAGKPQEVNRPALTGISLDLDNLSRAVDKFAKSRTGVENDVVLFTDSATGEKYTAKPIIYSDGGRRPSGARITNLKTQQVMEIRPDVLGYEQEAFGVSYEKNRGLIKQATAAFEAAVKK